MSNDNKMSIRDSIVKYSKFLFPAIVILVAACTVSYALGANSRKTEQPEESAPPAEETVAPVSLEGEGSDEQPEEDAPKETPLILSEDAGIQALIASYYDTMASGDSAAMTALYDEQIGRAHV